MLFDYEQSLIDAANGTYANANIDLEALVDAERSRRDADEKYLRQQEYNSRANAYYTKRYENVAKLFHVSV